VKSLFMMDQIVASTVIDCRLSFRPALVHYPVEDVFRSPAPADDWCDHIVSQRTSSYREVLMSGQHFRFLHTGGFALDEPLRGLAEVPEPLVELFIDAPFQAAQKVFDAALEERVDFVALNGDLLDLSYPSARAIAFLLDNFERLDAQGISVYWACGRVDQPQDWPAVAALPGRVKQFAPTAAEELSHFRGERPVANIVGRSWHGTAGFQVGEFKNDDDGLPTIVIANGTSDSQRLADQMVDYWALGGQVQRQTMGSARRVIHYAGSPQGRTSDEIGPHGCTLVHVAGDRTIRAQFTPTDSIRWHTERISIEEETTLDGVRRQLADRVKQLRGEAESRPLIVTWKLRGGTHLAGPAGRRDLAAEWQEWLRKEHFLHNGKPALWTLVVELEQPELPAAWFDEESMLGDFLRNLRDLAAVPPAELSLTPQIPEQHRVPALATLGNWTEDEHRTVLYEAALTGAQLLGAAERDA
jgi:DNA repair protein SbcD/Mre11